MRIITDGFTVHSLLMILVLEKFKSFTYGKYYDSHFPLDCKEIEKKTLSAVHQNIHRKIKMKLLGCWFLQQEDTVYQMTKDGYILFKLHSSSDTEK